MVKTLNINPMDKGNGSFVGISVTNKGAGGGPNISISVPMTSGELVRCEVQWSNDLYHTSDINRCIYCIRQKTDVPRTRQARAALLCMHTLGPLG